jgi:aspartate aminotransferase-like enzyme
VSVSGRFWLPGPVEVDPDVLEAMTRPMIGHRTVAGHALAERLQRGLRRILGTDRPVLLATASATAMMEAAIRSGVPDRLLAVVSGTFGERFARIAERCGKEVIRVHVPRGEAMQPDQLAEFLDGPPIDAVSMVHVETSTGALAPIGQLIATVRARHDTLTVVDAVGSVGAMAVDPAGWNADLVIGASHKGLAVPPGLAFAVASERFLERARQVGDRGLYLDIVELHAAAAGERFPQTPALPICHALDRQLERIVEGGLEGRYDRHRAMRERVEHWAMREAEFTLLAPAGRRADSVSALVLPEGTSATALVSDLASDGFTIAPGLDDDLDRLIRIGHMGDVTSDQLDHLLATLDARL